MKCEKCGKDHDGSYGSGRFCSQKCACSFSTKAVNYNELKDGNCSVCGKEMKIKKFASSLLVKCEDCRKQRFYSKSGYKKPYQEKVIVVCYTCGKEFKRIKSRVSKTNFCCKKCYLEGYGKSIRGPLIKKWLETDWNPTKGKSGEIPKFIRKYLFDKHNNKCTRCGWSKINETTGLIPLEVEHLDGDWKNNRPENLDLICPNCHSLTSTYRSLNNGNGRPRK